MYTNISFTIKAADGTVHEETFGVSDMLLIMVKPGTDGGLVVEGYEPLELDDHPDTLRQIGGHIVDFAKKRE